MNLRPRRRECPRFINLTSLIDVVFNLLIFFMVSTTFNRMSEIQIALPNAESGQSLSDKEPTIEILIDAQGNYLLRDGQKELSFTNQEIAPIRAALEQSARNLASNSARDSELIVIISADGRAPHQAVVTVMDAARQVGLNHLTFSTQHPTLKP